MPNFTALRPLTLVLLAALPCLAVDCGRREPVPCTSQRVGRLALPPRSRTWLPAAPPDSVRFVNSRGFRLSLYRVPGVEAPGDSVALPYAYPDYTAELLRPEPRPTCGPFFQAERRRLRYAGRRLPVALDYALTRDLSGTYPGWTFSTAYSPSVQLTAVADTLPDVVAVSFNEKAIALFPVVRRPFRQPFGPVRYVDTVRVAGQLLRGVYQYELSTFGQSAGTVAPLRLYFQPGQGVVGFTYTNNEEWARY